MEKYFQPSEPNRLRHGDQQASRPVAMIEECNRLKGELRETLVQEFARILPQFEGQPELQNACMQEAVSFPRRKKYFSRCNISTQTRGKNLSGPNFAPHLKKRRNTLTHYLSMRCIIRYSLARDVIKGLRLATKKANMKNQVQEINESEFATEVMRYAQPVLVGFLAGWSKPSRMIEPVLDEVAEACNGNAKIFKVNVDDNPDLGTIYSIQSVPTLIYFLNGAVRAKIVGMASPKAVLAKLNSLTPGNPPTTESGRPQ
jgi:thioredoxin 1